VMPSGGRGDRGSRHRGFPGARGYDHTGGDAANGSSGGGCHVSDNPTSGPSSGGRTRGVEPEELWRKRPNLPTC
jgi:hypothetical protein